MTATESRPADNGAARDPAEIETNIPAAERIRARLDPSAHPDPVLVAASVVASGWPVLLIRPGSKSPVHAGSDRPNHGDAWITDPTALVDAVEDYAQRNSRARKVAPSPAFAVMTGQPGSGETQDLALVALDVDGSPADLSALLVEAGADAEQWAEETLRVGRGDPSRWHLYGIAPTGRAGTSRRLTPGLEWRADGGYILLPGSRHPSFILLPGNRRPTPCRYEITAGLVEFTDGPHPAGAIYGGLTDDLAVAWRYPLPIPHRLLDVIESRILPPSGGGLSTGEVRRRLPSRPTTSAVTDAENGTDGAQVGAGVLHPYAAAAVAAELARLDALPRPWQGNGSDWDTTTYRVACNLVEFANSSWSGYTLEQAEQDLMDHAPFDAVWGVRKHREKWDSARKKIGGKCRLRPDNGISQNGLTVEIITEPSNDKDDLGKATMEPDETRVTSWREVDLTDIISGIKTGTLKRLRPTVGTLSLANDDAGAALFYRGKVNGVAGESGSGKGWTVLTVSVQEIAAGVDVVYVDLEDTDQSITERLLDLGATEEDIRARFHYVSPTERFTGPAKADLTALCDATEPGLVIVDSTGEGLGLDGKNPNADEEVATWFRELPRYLADHPAAPAVVVLDHVSKTDGSGLWPIGSQRKRAAIGGAQYMQRIVRPFAHGVPGTAVLVCAKDRHGCYRLGQEVAELVVTPLPGNLVGAELVAVADTGSKSGQPFRPTNLMEKVSRYLENHPGSADRTGRQIRDNVKGRAATITEAVEVLHAEGYARAESGPRNSTVYTHVRPFRESADRVVPDEHRSEG